MLRFPPPAPSLATASKNPNPPLVWTLSRHFRFRHCLKPFSFRTAAVATVEEGVRDGGGETPKRLRWDEICRDPTEAQAELIVRLSPKLSRRCLALARRVVCFSPLRDGDLRLLLLEWVRVMKPRRADWLAVLKELKRLEVPLLLELSRRCLALARRVVCFSPLRDGDLRLLLLEWVRVMKPRRADWLAVLKELKRLEVPLLLEAYKYSPPSNLTFLNAMHWCQVFEFALLEETFEANIRDYTKIIDAYAKQNRPEDAETAFLAMKNRGFTCDQVTLTVLVHMYSKAGHLNRAKETFEEIKLLGLPMDRRAYDSMIMAYIRAGMPERGESLIREMDAQQIYAGKEVYKALLRAYSTTGDTGGAQRVFNAIQLAGTFPDARLCALLVNAYCEAGQCDKARIVLDNMRKAGLEPSDKCVALMLRAYEKVESLEKAMSLLMDMEKCGVVIGKEASEVLAKWFHRLGVVNEIEHVLRDYAS
ncbi:Pentatricopeptide repeat-containing protein [Acorus calamus]|uniref:Pentatricopeptide repeat-containing protein n=1 Tax=Acorus calamus TaxID=4465 RepID=A0AAV9FLQ4_ACOCL|nr:Pentatricopeptide repeat-containing protein [Acorus calamus]